MVGQPIEFTASHLDASAAAYDPAKWRAPLVVGHPKTNAPAYGWVDKLASLPIGLEADPADVEPAFAEMVNAKRFANISASFWAPDAPGNPVPGVYYLRHVGFLGAVPPSIKGLRTPEFGDSADGIVEFSEWDDVDNAGLWRRMREWVIAKFGLADADQVVPSYLVDGLGRSAQRELDESLAEDPPAAAPLAPAFSDPAQETSVTPEEKAALEAENARLRAQLAASDAATRHQGNVAFAEGLMASGRLAPAHQGMAVAMLDFMGSQAEVLEFGEGDDKAPLADAFKAFLEGLPVVPEFSEEVATKDRAANGVVDFADSTSIAHAAVAYQTEQAERGIHVSTSDAVRHVETTRSK
ncbi:MAG: hypothetical protein J0L85_13770 [Zoogloea sp.]|nr:hypothetical protein [Zoogloea sp.]MCA0184708.1 peptidase [Pseudomonadota bacterium]